MGIPNRDRDAASYGGGKNGIKGSVRKHGAGFFTKYFLFCMGEGIMGLENYIGWKNQIYDTCSVLRRAYVC